MHVRHRGVNRENCFREDVDRLVYLSCLKDLAKTTACSIHAYCLMTNHVHLLLTPSDLTSCAALMRELGQRYVPYFNRRHNRTGTLWEGRFRSCIVESARYALGCYRYIECNPVEAHMVTALGAYRWSSHAGNCGLMEDKLITPHVEYDALGTTLEARRSAYRGLFDVPRDPELAKTLRQATVGGYALVGDELKRQLVANGDRVAPAKPGPKRKPDAEAGPASADLLVN
jgi:putative transposase